MQAPWFVQRRVDSCLICAFFINKNRELLES
jgi:hypothetical protein